MKYSIVLGLALVFSMTLKLESNGQERENSNSPSQQADLPQPTKKIPYKKTSAKEFSLHVFEPNTEAAKPDRSCIVFFFGGGWTNGDPKQFYSQCRKLADLGMVAIAAEYRVSSRDQSKVVDSIADAQDALAFVRDSASSLRIAPNRIAAGGGSAGGHLAATLATLSYRGVVEGRQAEDYRPDALVLFNPVLVLAPTGSEKDAKQLTSLTNLKDRIGDEPITASPFHHLTKELPPTIIFHGVADVTVPYWTMEAFRDKAIQIGAKCELKGYEGETHGFFNRGRPKFEEVQNEMIQFLVKQQLVQQ
jgi:acetyl esterase